MTNRPLRGTRPALSRPTRSLLTLLALPCLVAGCDGSLATGRDGGSTPPTRDGAAGTDAGVPPADDAGGPGGDAGTPGGDAGVPPAPTDNRFGIGLVSPGDAAQMEMTANLTGPGGFVKMIFPGVVPGMTEPPPDWANAVREAYARDLVPVVRFGPPWGDRRVRNQSDEGSDGLAYTALARSYVNVVRGLPLREGWPLYVEVHNEPNLCYEWACDRGRFEGDRISSERIAQEYASMLRDVADALHGMDDPRIRVTNGGLAPGGVRWCECVGPGEGGFEAGNTSNDFLAQMAAAVPGVFDRLDAFSSHSYPASNHGYGFFVPYDASVPGLTYFETELATIGRPDLPVLMTETGWPSTHGGTTYGSREDVAAWTRQAYENVWLTHPNVLGVMPFILQDPGAWDGFAWVRGDGSPYPVYGEVRALRCASIPGRCP
ncbi:MAG TPA: hypothetical protein RMH99_30135 [Sandaracinaceae bacterium LLY-WYZ-13_1]|nr:hypothetical protein [Sandaracinaceae bacterium LLY-WYZ-13_1]